MRKLHSVLGLIGVLALVAAACGSNNGTASGGGSASVSLASPSGAMEGALKLIAWPGYTPEVVGEAVRDRDRLQGHGEVRHRPRMRW